MVESNEKLNEETEEMDMEEMEDQDFASLFESSMQELNVGDVVLGTIVQVTDDHVVVDVGYKSEGVIPLYEFKDEEGKIDIKVGDEVDVLFERRENDSGLIGLSKEKADRQKIWGSLEEGAVVEGKIVGRIKSGGQGYTIKKAIAYAYLPIAHTEVGTSVDVEFFGTWRSGVICAEPLFDPANERIRC